MNAFTSVRAAAPGSTTLDTPEQDTLLHPVLQSSCFTERGWLEASPSTRASMILADSARVIEGAANSLHAQCLHMESGLASGIAFVAQMLLAQAHLMRRANRVKSRLEDEAPRDRRRPAPRSDVELLALGRIMDAAQVAAREANETLDGDEDGETLVFQALADACARIVAAPPARTERGRQIKAAAVMQEFSFCCDSDGNWDDPGDRLAWTFLKEIAGDAYKPTHKKGHPE